MILAASVVVLWIPAPLLYPASAKDWLAHTRSTRFRIEQMLGTWQHWLDLVRAFGGTFFLTAAAADIAFQGPEGNHWERFLVGGILALAVTFQTVQFRKNFYFTAPIFYLWGVALVLVDWPIALFAIVFSVILARLADQVELKLPLMAGLLGVAGYLVNGLSLDLVIAVGLTVLPVIIAFGSLQHLVCYSWDRALE